MKSTTISQGTQNVNAVILIVHVLIAIAVQHVHVQIANSI
jgi:hypothetical protein